MRHDGLARAYGTLTARERLTLMVSAGARGDLFEVGRVMDSATSRSAAWQLDRAEKAFREVILWAAIDLSRELGELSLARLLCTGLPILAILQRTAAPEHAELLAAQTEHLEVLANSIRDKASGLLAGIEEFGQRICGIGACRALSLYAPKLIAELGSTEVEFQHVTGQMNDQATNMFQTWRAIMGASTVEAAGEIQNRAGPAAKPSLPCT